MMLEALLGHPLTLRLGWTLAHTIWQGLALAGFLGLGLLLLGPDRIRLANLLASLTLFLWLLAPGVTFLALPAASSAPVRVVASDGTETGGTPEAREISPQIVRSATDDRSTPTKALSATAMPIRSGLKFLLPYAALAWISVASLLALRLLGGFVLVQRLARAGKPVPALQPRLDALARRLGVRRRVRLLMSTLVDVPTALGWFKPVVLLPVSAISGLTRDQLDLILAHELAHIRRYDYLLNILQGVAEALLFYHPLTWWLSCTLRSRREHACDDLALSATGSAPLALAEALTRLETARPAPVPALAATGTLTHRVHRLLGLPQASTLQPGVATAALACLVLLSVALTALAESAAEATSRGLRSVVLDAAHGAGLPGASGQISEADLTLAVALRARELLEQEGVDVVLTREGDEALAPTLAEDRAARAAFATEGHDVYIALHAATASDPASRGVAVHVSPRRSEERQFLDSTYLADAILAAVTRETGARDQGRRESRLPELELVDIPAVSVDLGFLSNEAEGERLASSEYQDRLAKGLANGILAYLERQQPERGAEPDAYRNSYSWLTILGSAHISEDAAAVTRLASDAVVVLERRGPDGVSKLVLTAGPDEQVCYELERDGSTSTDCDGQSPSWYTELLSDYVRETVAEMARDFSPSPGDQTSTAAQWGHDSMESLIWSGREILAQRDLLSVGKPVLRQPDYQDRGNYRQAVEGVLSQLAHRRSHGLITTEELRQALDEWLGDEVLTSQSREAWRRAILTSELPEIRQAAHVLELTHGVQPFAAWRTAALLITAGNGRVSASEHRRR